MNLLKTGLKVKILSIILIIISTSAIILTYSTYTKLKEDIYQKNNEVFQMFTNTFLSEKDILIRKYSMSLDIMLENRPLVTAFRNRDRETLKTLVTDLYNSRLKHFYDIEQFQFHTPPAKSFYRAHAPSRFGDDLSAFRKTVLQANRDKNMVTGLEVGRAGLGLRVVKPVWYNYDFIGTVEFGGSIENMLTTPANATGINYAVGIFTKSLQRSKFFYEEDNRYTYKNMYMQNYSSNIIKKLITSGRMDLEGNIIKMDRNYYMVKNIPLNDFSSDHIGYLLISRDTTAEIHAMHRELAKQITIILSYAAAALALLTIIMVKLIFSPLEKITKHISEIQVENALPAEPIIIKGNSEISMLANAYNILNEKLKESFKKINSNIIEIQEINTSLENRVLERTKQLEETNSRLKNAMAEIQTANEAKSDFLANMSHEIRTPMNAVMGLSYLLMQTELSTKQYDYVSKIRSSANMLLELINDVLDFSKIEAGKLELDYSVFSLKEIIKNISGIADVYVSRKDVVILTDIDSAVPDYLLGDSLRISQVLNNLAVNAAKFTESGEIRISAKLLTANEKYAKIKISVADTGIGIPSERIPTLFDSFTQVKSKKHGGIQGSGLGLSITKKILEAMDSEISVESTEGAGSVFTFNLTLETAEKPDTEKENEDEHNFINKRILVCEHSPESGDSVSSFFRENMANVLSVTNQFDLIKQINNNIDCRESLTFNLIFIDTRMLSPDALHTIGSSAQNSHDYKFPPFILLCDEKEYEQELRSILSGMQLHIIGIHDRFTEISELSSKLLSGEITLKPDVECFKRTRYNKLAVKVLIADDNDINLQVMTEFAHMLGLSCFAAKNGEEAVEAFENDDFDIIFMDLIMPQMDGIQAAETIRKSSRNSSIPIYALTASTAAEDIEKCRKIGMNGHIAKPVKLHDISRALKECDMNADLSGLNTPEQIDAEVPESDDILNVESAVKYLSGNKKLYIELLEKYYREYGGQDIRAAEISASGDFTEAGTFFHTLKGVTKAIGAEHLSIQCEKLEKLAKQHKDVTDTKTFTRFIQGARELDKKLRLFFESN